MLNSCFDIDIEFQTIFTRLSSSLTPSWQREDQEYSDLKHLNPSDKKEEEAQSYTNSE